MVPSSSNPAQSETSDRLTSEVSRASEIAGIKTDQMFRLIDSILPFEACLYYQFLPIALEGRHLKLGMVSPHDSSALDYVRRILAFLNCSLKTERIAAEVHQSLLSAYLNHVHSSSASTLASNENKIVPSEPPERRSLTVSQTTRRELGRQSGDVPPTTSPSQPVSKNRRQSLPPNDSPLAESDELQVASRAKSLVQTSHTSPLAETLPLLDVQALHLSRPMEFIATLAPQQMWHELLGRALIGGIGRLYFERQPNGGRVLWSQDGVLQSVLDGLSLSAFQGLIMELKHFVDIPLLPVTHPKQIEVERRYQQECVLLRLQVMPGVHGEEAKLQVLRGVALKFYQRQHLEKLGQEALELAGHLQRKLDEIRDRSQRYSTPLEALPTLHQLLRSLDEQLEAIARVQVERPSDN